MKRNYIFELFIFINLSAHAACNQHTPQADLVVFNARVYTVDSAFSIAQAFAIKNGHIIAVGSNDEIKQFHADSVMDLNGRSVYPGFYDAHCHFYGYGIDLKKIWLTGTSSYSEILDTLIAKKDHLFMGWLFGRGWDQNDWKDKAYPNRRELDSIFPDVPVLLLRIDGHAALVNKKALQICGITAQTTVEGGEIILENGNLTGLLIDNAVDLVKSKIPVPDQAVQSEALLMAQKNCFAVGLTSVVDAGLDPQVIAVIDSLQKLSRLKMRIDAMLSYSPANIAFYKKKGILQTDRLRVGSVKLYADGALGSRGACLMHAYGDLPGHKGFLLHSIDSLKYAASLVREMGFQLNTHCIGDSANRLLLQIYSSVLKGPNDLRWRIEHAQCLDAADFRLFRDFSIIPSVQPVHATSDMYWAKERLGANRLKSAYAYRQLLLQNGLLASGSDFPVEDINPLFGYYAAVVRKDQKGFPESGFQMENALTRMEALQSMTIWAAYASFQEKYRGSLEVGKDADFVVLDMDIMKASDKELYKAKVLHTWIAGERVY